jgi:hypothetical protein
MAVRSGHLKLVDGRDSPKAVETISRKKGHIEATHDAFLKKITLVAHDSMGKNWGDGVEGLGW